MKYEVVVELKKEVLDTQGRAIRDTLVRNGFDALQSVQVSKRFLLECAGNEAQAEAMAKKIAQEVLANPVSETYQVRKLTDSP